MGAYANLFARAVQSNLSDTEGSRRNYSWSRWPQSRL